MNIRWRLSGLLQTGLGILAVATLVSCSAATSGAMSKGSGSTISRPPATSATEGLYTVAQAKRGEHVYKEQCVTCHLDDLLGDDCAPPLAGPYFSAKWNGLPVGDMYEIMRQSMPIGAPPLSPQQYVDIIGYLLSFNGTPAGATELPIELQKLNAVKFHLVKSH
jgi:mono/diheme cytochrome c family protein